MANFRPTIRKLLLALSTRGEKYSLEHFQFWSAKANRMCTTKKLSKIVYSDEKSKWVKEEVISTYSDVDIVKTLAKIYEEGVSSGK